MISTDPRQTHLPTVNTLLPLVVFVLAVVTLVLNFLTKGGAM